MEVQRNAHPRRSRPRPSSEIARWEEARALPDVLDRGLVVAHLWVLAELLLGGMPPRAAALYQRLPRARPVGVAVLVELIERTRPVGVGLVDIGLLAAAQRDGLRLWTLDGALRDHAAEAGLDWSPGS